MCVCVYVRETSGVTRRRGVGGAQVEKGEPQYQCLHATIVDVHI